MLEGGEDPLYIARRMIRMASEDIGMADSQALHLVSQFWGRERDIAGRQAEIGLIRRLSQHISQCNS